MKAHANKLYGIKNVPIRVPTAILPRSLRAQHPILRKMSFGSASGSAAFLQAASMISIL